MTQNWRTRVNAQDHFGQEKRRAEIEQRRPALRSPRDLGLGPGIGASAVKVTNWNDLLAQYDGYFSSEVGAFGAPNDTEAFVGLTINDSTLGGVQEATGVVSGNHYRRVFRRNPSDARSVSFAAWDWTNEPVQQPGVESFNETMPNPIIVPVGEWRVDSFNLERWGRHAMIRFTATWTGATIAQASIDHTNRQMATITDVNWRPIFHTGTQTYSAFRAVSLNSDTGGINMTAGLVTGAPTTANTDIPNNSAYSFGMSYLLPKNVV